MSPGYCPFLQHFVRLWLNSVNGGLCLHLLPSNDDDDDDDDNNDYDGEDFDDGDNNNNNNDNRKKNSNDIERRNL